MTANNINRTVFFATLATLTIALLSYGATVGALYIGAGSAYLDKLHTRAVANGTPLR